jgi:hypothetical protein
VKRRELALFVIALLLSAIVGGLIGDIIGTYLPDGGAKTLLSKSLVIGFDTVKADFYAISFTIGLMFKINLMSVIFVVLMALYLRSALL